MQRRNGENVPDSKTIQTGIAIAVGTAFVIYAASTVVRMERFMMDKPYTETDGLKASHALHDTQSDLAHLRREFSESVSRVTKELERQKREIRRVEDAVWPTGKKPLLRPYAKGDRILKKKYDGSS